MENKPEDTLPDKESIPSSEIVEEKVSASTDKEPKPTLTLNGNKDGGERTAAEESRNDDDSAEIEDSLVVANTENDNKELKTVEEKTKLEDSSTVNALEIVRESKEVIESELLDNKSSDSIRDDFDSNNLDISKEELGKGRRARVPNKRYSDILSPKLSEMPPTKIRRLTINGESAAQEPPVAIAEPTPPINRKKKTIDMANPRFLKPFDYGWRRELVYRAQSEYGIKRPGDIYYYSPLGKKVRSMRELAECLTDEDLSLEDFTFYKESLNVNDTEKEIIRDAKLRTAPSGEAKENTGKKKIKSTAGSKNVKANNNNKKVISSKSKSSKSTGFKIKFPSKSKKDRRRPKETLQEEDFDSEDQSEWDAVPINTKPQSNLAIGGATKPCQPCSIRCLGALGTIPTLQCCQCLCLYHYHCAGVPVTTNGIGYICKNCHHVETPSVTTPLLNLTPLPPPQPPPIPTPSQNLNDTTNPSIPPKDNPNNKGILLGSAASWFQSNAATIQVGDDAHNQIPALPKRPQLVEFIGGRKYLVVPRQSIVSTIGHYNNANNNASKNAGNNAGNNVNKNAGNSSNNSTENNNDNSTGSYGNLDVSPSVEDDIPTGEVVCETANTPVSEASLHRSSDNVETTAATTTETATTSLDCTMDEVEKDKETESMEIVATITTTTTTTATREDDTKMDVDEEEEEYFSEGGTKSKKKSSRLHLPPVVGSISPTPPLDTEDETPSPRSAQNPEFMNSYFQHLSYGYNTLISVFQHLKVQDLLRAGCVCTMWRDLASHPRLWRTVRMKNSQIHSFEGLAAALARQGTQQLDLRKMLLPTGDLKLWDSFSEAIQHVDTLRKIEFCRCPADVVEKIAASNRGLEILNATTIKCEQINLDAFGNLLNLKELRLKSTVALTLTSDLSALKGLKSLRHLSLTSIRDLYKLDLEVLGSLVTLVSLDIGECVNLPKSFGSEILRQLTKLEKLRLEKGQGNCNTFDILETVHSMPKLEQLELVNFDIKAGFDKSLGACGNLRRLLIIPTYISQSATTNHMVLGGVLRLQATLSHFVWGVTLELLRVTELFVDQCDEPGKKKERKVPTGAGDSIPVLKPVPIIGALMDTLVITDPPQVEILPLPNLQKLLLQNLPTTRVKILKIPFHATWRQSITDSVN